MECKELRRHYIYSYYVVSIFPSSFIEFKDGFTIGHVLIAFQCKPLYILLTTVRKRSYRYILIMCIRNSFDSFKIED
jgi:hypothetical protein